MITATKTNMGTEIPRRGNHNAELRYYHSFVSENNFTKHVSLQMYCLNCLTSYLWYHTNIK